ncbi:hypothetical protein HX045_13210 [Myroides odoratimimus]|uniref:Uncharacterized protein n=3 Tax=Myroides odoratimimus TaxID=76832 RepID=A0A0S7EC68_9FLAO|nr:MULTISPECIES: hypothetical protein [Myroides]AJA69846.1 hypothetical protein MYRA21_2737 [Myroides sp. A21]ALU27098.1 hypothetical protein AS202_13455 [Myroides odoratimimus]APA93121.1 hypothetical protein BK054_13005 [Myroides sp. ZB35]EHO08559.1 hypothetical protein HMPREF9712_02221 [Myroides odoratimimus CCUG 10230]EHO09965.1 hypothetical protein HMPREF9714_01650 [Myroides odoratimimus CCUG 12901]
MKELDLLKKHWNSDQKFPKISTEEIQKMIHKKSSSIVMWIFIISIIEFIVLNGFSYLFGSDVNRNDIGPIYAFMINNLDWLSLGISVIFITIFYLNYKKISVADSTKLLMESILKTKKTVNYYIYTNLIIFFIAFIIILIDILTHDDKLTLPTALISAVIVIIICGVFLGLLWLYYRLIYGLLIKRLMKNYTELEKIDYE